MATGALGDFVARRKPAWDDLSSLVLRAGGTGGVRNLSRDELKAIGPLYRRAAADLAYVRMRSDDPGLILYLNDLVTRAHGLLYAERGPGVERLSGFIRVGLPRLLRKRMIYIVLAFSVFVAGGILGAGLTIADSSTGHIFLGSRADETTFYRDLPKELKDPDRPVDAALLMQNNIKVAILAFAVGVLGGFPTLLILFQNGLPIGSLAVLQHRAGYDIVLWSFLLPHGVPELSAIFISGGAGMLIGHALVAPGEISRRDALVAAGSDAVRLLFGAAMLLIIAGFTESFVSPTSLPAWAKFTYAAFGATVLGAYVNSGRANDAREKQAAASEERRSMAFSG